MTDPARRARDIAFEALTAEDDGRVCRDISDAACRQEPGSVLRHVAALTLSKSADGLSDAKLVLSWLMTALGAPAALVGLLVPLREAGALVPQLFTAARIRAMPRRKWAWAAAAAGQGLAVLAMVLAALTLRGVAAGVAILAALTLLALARSVASVSYKDVLGKTVDKSRRGSATGTATSASAVAVLIFAGLLMAAGGERMGIVLGALVVAGAAWLAAAAIFATLAERPGATEGGGNGIAAALGNLGRLRDDPQLARFVAVRGLLTATALSPPYLVVLAAGSAGAALRSLGALVLASALAALVSGRVWGRLADRSSRQVLIVSGLGGAAASGLALALAGAGLAGTVWALPLALFGVMVAHQGVRLGRSTWLVDMADADTRAIYTALANTAIGLILLLAGGAGAALAGVAPAWALALYTAMALAGAWLATGLKEVSG